MSVLNYSLKEFSGFNLLSIVQLSMFCVVVFATTLLDYHIFRRLSTTFLFFYFLSFAVSASQLVYNSTVFRRSQALFLFFSKVFSLKISNGERGIWTLAPLLTTYSLSRGAPSASWVFLQAKQQSYKKNKAERVGFEPTVPYGITGFQDQLLKPLGHLSIWALVCFSWAAKPLTLYPTTNVLSRYYLCFPCVNFLWFDFILHRKWK